MNEQRRQILEMLADGKITADEAERLIDALGQEVPEPPPAVAARPKGRPKHLRVLVNTEDDGLGTGPTRINIRVPLRLLSAGVRLTSLIPPVAVTKVNEQLARSGVPFDLGQLKPEQLEDLVDSLDDISVDLDEPGTKVQVFCE
ncbi:hypothetical protein OHA21_14590 [Actinoplanes sp. NBC_00393]|uniref:SHOCT-like domain-containing protein n=1 Tax=Actinoplanes sp. NBC_00393 TaxID=2975953 RepID=UPI002E245A6F